MSVFSPENVMKTERSRRLYALYELVYTAVDVLAALMFIAGSVLFFSEETQTAGTWCFLAGSLFFAAKPALRIAREIHYWRWGEMGKLARRAEG
jgi:hypothetical protein